jgi:hypothetical protein
MCTVASFPDISVHLTIDEARRVGDLNIDLSEVEIIRWRRKVRDAVRDYDTAETYRRQGRP